MKSIGIIGYGNMGKAIAERIKDKYAVCVFDQDSNKISALENITAARNPVDLVKQSEVIILAVKPQDFNLLLNEIRDFAQYKLIVSIAAGITTEYIRSQLGEEVRIIRVMPNLPAQIGQGVSALFKDKFATDQDLDLAWQLLSYIGLALPVDNELMLNAATAVSGSSPAFFCQYIKDKINADEKRNEFIEMLTAAAISVNFDGQFARTISVATVNGTIAILKEKKLSCEELIKLVASKGGTTQAGLDVLNSGGSLEDAVVAARDRAEELSKKTSYKE